VIEVTSGGGILRLQVSNNGAAGPSSSAGPAERSREGRGLANLTARVQAVGGRLASGYDGERFRLIAELPASGLLGAKPAAAAGPLHPPGLPAARPVGSRASRSR
jgi:signal transduction histidine kinase